MTALSTVPLNLLMVSDKLLNRQKNAQNGESGGGGFFNNTNYSIFVQNENSTVMIQNFFFAKTVKKKY